jgi:uncharacterized protein involved in response to NO
VDRLYDTAVFWQRTRQGDIVSSAMAFSRSRHSPPWLSHAFRPFFLASALWAAFALGVWIVVLRAGTMLPSRFDPLSWHIHEMLFGFVLATIAGFLLTAIANWTGRPPVRASILASLAGLWLAGRIVCLVSLALPIWFAAVVDVAFPVALMAVCAYELIQGAKLRNLLLLLPVGTLAIANLLMYLEAAGVPVPLGLGWHLGLAAILVLLSVIGGRVIPAFTRNWLNKQGAHDLPGPHGTVDRFALGTLHVGLIAWAFLPYARWVGGLLVLGAIVNAWRLWRWHGVATRAEPLLTILHIGYGWLVIGIFLLGLNTAGMDVPLSAAIHALTVGTIGTMILGLMTRVTLGHTGRSLSADRTTVSIYGLVSLAALTRIAAAVLTDTRLVLLTISAVFWIAAFLLFLASYGGPLLRPRADGR